MVGRARTGARQLDELVVGGGGTAMGGWKGGIPGKRSRLPGFEEEEVVDGRLLARGGLASPRLGHTRLMEPRSTSMFFVSPHDRW